MSEEDIEAARNWLSDTTRRDSWDADIAAIWEALVAIGYALVAIAEKP